MEQYKNFFLSRRVTNPDASKELSDAIHKDFDIDEAFMKRFENTVLNANNRTNCKSDDDYLIANSFVETLKRQMGSIRQYKLWFNDVIMCDELNYLELCGCFKTSKKFYIIFDFSQCLDYVIAFLAHEDYTIVRQSIDRVCEKYKISYRVLSRALCTGETDLLTRIPVELFYEISPKLTEFLKNTLVNRRYLSGIPLYEGIKISRLTDAQLIQVTIQLHIFCALQYILNLVLDSVVTYKKQIGIPISLSSKGYSNLVFQADTMEFTYTPEIDLPSVGKLRVYPMVLNRGIYFDRMIKNIQKVERIEVI